MATHLAQPQCQYEDEKMNWGGRIGGSSASMEVNATQAVPIHVACEPFRRTGRERALYEWLVRDNRELRESIFDFLKVRFGQCGRLLFVAALVVTPSLSTVLLDNRECMTELILGGCCNYAGSFVQTELLCWVARVSRVDE